MHIHPAPDPSVVRRLDTLETALAAQDAGMRAIVVKSFFYPTTAVANVAKHVAPDVKVFGSIVIDDKITGGLDYAAQTIETHAKVGCKVLWFPAFGAKFCRNALGMEGGIYILGDDHKLKPQVHDILKVVKDYNMVLCSGHISYEESAALFEAAAKLGINKMVCTHPLLNQWTPLTMEQMKTIASMGAYIEHCYGVVMPRNGSFDPKRLVEAVKEVGAEHTIMSTDLAQITDPTPAEGMRLHIAMMLQFGCTEQEVELMVKTNPAKLLDLD
jgi:hypothetical protein